MSVDQDQALAGELRAIYLAFEGDGEAAIARLATLYDSGVVFRDPLQTLRGRDAFVAMNRRILRRARGLSFDVTSAVGADSSIFLAWTMLYQPRLGPTVVFEGATHARTRAGLIVEQRDYWDLLSSFAQSVPIVRDVYASLAPHLG